MFLYGKNSVEERLKSNPASVKRVYVETTFHDPHLLSLINNKKIHIKRVNERELLRIKRADRLQGIVAEVDRFEYTAFEEMLGYPKRKNMSLICLDSLNDPHNLGSIIRTAACLGDFAVVIPVHSSCQVNDTVMHVASGGENYVPVSRVVNMSTALIKAKKAGYWIIGTVVGDGEDITKMTLPFPICIVLGSEGKGIRHGISKQLEMRVSLPMKGASLSYNVAMASSIFCYEIYRQKEENNRLSAKSKTLNSKQRQDQKT